jgi:chaperone BCS1
MVVNWAATQPFAYNVFSSLASVGIRKRPFTDGHLYRNQKKWLQYSPWNGRFFLWYREHLLTFRSEQKVDRFFEKEKIAISCIGRSSHILKDLLSECRTKYLALVKDKTSVMKHTITPCR